VFVSAINTLRLQYLCNWNIRQAAKYLNPAMEPDYYANKIDHCGMATEHLQKVLQYLVELGYNSQNSGYSWYYEVIKHTIGRLGWVNERYFGRIMDELAIVSAFRIGESHRYIYRAKTPWSLLNR